MPELLSTNRGWYWGPFYSAPTGERGSLPACHESTSSWHLGEWYGSESGCGLSVTVLVHESSPSSPLSCLGNWLTQDLLKKLIQCLSPWTSIFSFAKNYTFRMGAIWWSVRHLRQNKEIAWYKTETYNAWQGTYCTCSHIILASWICGPAIWWVWCGCTGQ